MGESYFGFCQAISENQIPCVAYAVDTWTGEEHAGFYDDSVYQEVLAYNHANYAGFSYLLKNLFDDALSYFANESIDILHIDGLHTFEAVSHDLYSWLPKVRPGGIVLLHDVCVKHREFGVWKLWENLTAEGNTFAFHHSWGLGVFQKPGSDALKSELLKALFEGGAEVHEQVRRYYTLAAIELDSKHRAEFALRGGMEENYPRLQMYPSSTGGYQETNSQKVVVKPNEWQCVTMDIPEGVSAGAIRLDPADRPMIIDMRGIALLSAVDHKPLWSSSGSEISLLRVGGTLTLIDSADSNGACRFLSYGSDPQLYLPSLESGQLDQPLTLKIWLRLQTEMDALLPILEAPKEILFPDPEPPPVLIAEINSLGQDLENEKLAAAEVRIQLDDSQHDLEASRLERGHLVDDVNRKQTKLYLLEDLRREVTQENDELRNRVISLEKAYAELREKANITETAHSELEIRHKELLRKNQAIDTTLERVLHSRSWRLTAPLRSVTETLQGRSASGNSN